MHTALQWAQKIIDILRKELSGKAWTQWNLYDSELYWNIFCNANEKEDTRMFQNEFNVLDHSTVFLFTCHVLKNVVWIIEGKII